MESRHTLIYNYNVLVNGKHVNTNIQGWQNAIRIARKHAGDLFGPNKVEILNINTGEILSLENAEIQLIKWKNRKVQNTVNSGTT